MGNHTWQVFESPNSSSNCTTTGPELDNATGTNPPIFNNTLNGTTNAYSYSTDYVIIHTVSHNNGLCATTKCRKSFKGDFTGGGGGKNDKIISPNPSTGLINIDYKEAINENTQYIIKDALGKRVMQGSIKNQTTEIEIKENGIFLIEIWKGETMESVERVIIN
jgi:hypothetical protein